MFGTDLHAVITTGGEFGSTEAADGEVARGSHGSRTLEPCVKLALTLLNGGSMCLIIKSQHRMFLSPGKVLTAQLDP